VQTRQQLSDLPKTWLVDVDGVVFAHNGYLASEDETPLPGVAEFFRGLPDGDQVVLLSAREERYRAQTERQLARWGISYSALLLGLPVGERVLINDEKPRGLRTAWAVSVPRDAGIPLTLLRGRMDPESAPCMRSRPEGHER
jgi:hypothetical protein